MGGWQSTWTAISSGISGAPGTLLLKLGIPKYIDLHACRARNLSRITTWLTYVVLLGEPTQCWQHSMFGKVTSNHTLSISRTNIAIGVVACVLCFTPLPNQPSLRQSLCLQKRFKQRWTWSIKLLRTFVSTAARRFVRTVESCLQHPRKGKTEDRAKYSCYSSMIFDAHKNKSRFTDKK